MNSTNNQTPTEAELKEIFQLALDHPLTNKRPNINNRVLVNSAFFGGVPWQPIEAIVLEIATTHYKVQFTILPSGKTSELWIDQALVMDVLPTKPPKSK